MLASNDTVPLPTVPPWIQAVGALNGHTLLASQEARMELLDRAKGTPAQLDDTEAMPRRHPRTASQPFVHTPTGLPRTKPLPTTTAGDQIGKVDLSPYTTPAVANGAWATVYPDSSEEMDGNLVFSEKHGDLTSGRDVTGLSGMTSIIRKPEKFR